MACNIHESKAVSDQALVYVQDYGFVLCPIPPGTKNPGANGRKDWQILENCIQTAQQAEEYFSKYPSDGVGLVHGYSRTLAIDIDHLEYSRLAFEAVGIDLDELLNDESPKIEGKPGRAKNLYRLPDGVEGLNLKQLKFKDENGNSIAVFELRTGAGKQDVLPPSIHPDTKKPYTWKKPLNGSIPTTPDLIIDLLLNWDKYKRLMQTVLPGYQSPEPKRQTRTKPKKESDNRQVIEAFNDVHEVCAILDQYGYKRIGKRYLAPGSSSGIPGVIIQNGGSHIFSMHGSDPLAPDKGNEHRDAFDCYRILEHNGDWKKATRAAAELLGMDYRSNSVNDDNKTGKSSKDKRKSNEEEAEEKTTQAAELVAIAAEHELFHSPDGVGYATLKHKDHSENWELRTKPFKEWLARKYWQQNERVAGSQAIADAMNVIDAMANFDGKEHPVFVRTAEHDGKIYIDLCRDDWTCVEIDSLGWRVIPTAPVKFIRIAGMLPLPDPQHGTNIHDLLWNHVNIDEPGSRLLLTAWLVQALRSSGPYPVLVLTGEQGTAKSSTMRLLRMLTDPHTADVRNMPRNEHDLSIWAKNAQVLALDNLSGIPPWLSDALCRIATGGAFATRRLYTDTDEVLIHVQKPIMLNGIGEVASRQDLIDRSIIIELDPIPDDKRVEETELYAAFERDKPAIFGALLTAMSDALRNLPTTKLDNKPRMADFAKWASAAETAYAVEETTFIEAYTENRANAVESSLGVDAIAQAVISFMYDSERGKDGFSGTATALYKELKTYYFEVNESSLQEWPRSAAALSKRLTRIAPALRAQNIKISKDREKNARNILLDWVRKNSSQPSQPSRSDKNLTVTPFQR